MKPITNPKREIKKGEKIIQIQNVKNAIIALTNKGKLYEFYPYNHDEKWFKIDLPKTL